jgi:hypothetical protein
MPKDLLIMLYNNKNLLCSRFPCTLYTSSSSESQIMECKKSLASMNKNTSQDQILHFIHLFHLLATRWLCWYDCQRILVVESGAFLSQHHSTMVLHAHISPKGWTIGLLVATVQRLSLTPMTSSSSSSSYYSTALQGKSCNRSQNTGCTISNKPCVMCLWTLNCVTECKMKILFIFRTFSIAL